MAITATPRFMHKQRGVLPERHNANLADLLSGKYTICSISPDAIDRTDAIPVVVLFGGAGGVEKGLPGKKDGKHLVVAVSIEGDAITAQAIGSTIQSANASTHDGKP